MQKKLVTHEIVQNYAAPWRRVVSVMRFNAGGYGITVPYEDLDSIIIPLRDLPGLQGP